MAANTLSDCWNRIGILGEATCPNLDEFVHCRNCPAYAREGRALLDRESPEEYLLEWTSQLAQQKQVEAGDRISLVVFRLGKEWLALKTSLFENIVAARVIHTIPHRSNAVLLGLTNIRGELMLCASLAQVLGLQEKAETEPEESTKPSSRMIVLNNAGEQWVFPVDEVEGLHRLSASQMEQVPSTVAGAPDAHSLGIFKLGSKRVAFLDEHLIFAALKRSMHWQETM